MNRRTVIGIPPSYNKDESLELNSTAKYMSYLSEKDADTVMTTAGTSHFNLLSVDEVHALNNTVIEEFKKNKIIGIPALSTLQAVNFVKEYSHVDDDVSFMILYPERFYNHKQIIDYCHKIRNNTKSPLYVHGKTIRIASGGTWDYDHEIINKLFSSQIIKGIKEEHSNLQKSYDFVSNLHNEIDVIVAGGSMRRFEFLESAGANSFLSGIGNFYPEIEQEYLDGTKTNALRLETELFKIFMPIGWHKALRIGLEILELTGYNSRSPWSKPTAQERNQINKILKRIKNEK